MKVLNIRVKAYVRQQEKEDLVKVLEKFLPDDVEVTVEELAPEKEGGVFTHMLYKIAANLSKNKDVKELTEKILAGLSDKDKQKLSAELDKRVDKDCNLYIRLSKGKLADEKIVLRSNESVQVKLKVAAYPAIKDNALKVCGQLLNDGW